MGNKRKGGRSLSRKDKERLTEYGTLENTAAEREGDIENAIAKRRRVKLTERDLEEADRPALKAEAIDQEYQKLLAEDEQDENQNAYTDLVKSLGLKGKAALIKAQQEREDDEEMDGSADGEDISENTGGRDLEEENGYQDHHIEESEDDFDEAPPVEEDDDYDDGEDEEASETPPNTVDVDSDSEDVEDEIQAAIGYKAQMVADYSQVLKNTSANRFEKETLANGTPALVAGVTEADYILKKANDDEPRAIHEVYADCSVKETLRDSGSAALGGKKKRSKAPKSSNRIADFAAAVCSYKDVLETGIESGMPGTAARAVLTCHALNHVIRGRDRVLKNNAKLKAKADAGEDTTGTGIDDTGYADQGFTRPKVLVVLPMRNVAYEYVCMLAQLHATGKISAATSLSFQSDKDDNATSANDAMRKAMKKVKGQIRGWKRFYQEFADEEEMGNFSIKPKDFQQVFHGNIDDDFAVGVTVLRKGLRCYTKFYHADIILASPLRMRRIIGEHKDIKDRDTGKTRPGATGDYDFLSSIEVCIVDGFDTILMQNIDHLNHLLAHTNLHLKDRHEDTDFSRLRSWYIDGLMQNYRQTVILSRYDHPQARTLLKRHCANGSGKVILRTPTTQVAIARLLRSVPQTFLRFSPSGVADIPDARLAHFAQHVWPKVRQNKLDGVMIFTSTYFEFLKVQNWCKRSEVVFGKLSEYSDGPDVSRTRTAFHKGEERYVLMSERFHFFKRYRIKGIKHLIFYSLPENPQFYAELLNMIQSGTQALCMVLYCPHDLMKLERIIGKAYAQRLVANNKDTFMIA
eukprot:Clim_evm46s207 gene=Clim_evmTU46s207